MSDVLATVQAIYHAFGRGDIPAILDHLADDVRWEEWSDNSAQKAGVPWLKAGHGKEGALAFFQVIGGFEFKDLQFLSMMAGGNQVAVEIVLDVEIPATGAAFRDEEIHLWTFNDAGKVVRFRHYVDTAKHIAAAQGRRE